ANCDVHAERNADRYTNTYEYGHSDFDSDGDADRHRDTHTHGDVGSLLRQHASRRAQYWCAERHLCHYSLRDLSVYRLGCLWGPTYHLASRLRFCVLREYGLRRDLPRLDASRCEQRWC